MTLPFSHSQLGCDWSRSGYAPVVHCGSVRQAAKVLAMRELSLSELSSPGDTEAIAPALAAAAAILKHPGVLSVLGNLGRISSRIVTGRCQAAL